MIVLQQQFQNLGYTKFLIDI